MCDKDYWEEVISQAADECDLSLTKEQLSILASAASSGHGSIFCSQYQSRSRKRRMPRLHMGRRKETCGYWH